MRDSLNQILDNCPTHGASSHTAHKAFCLNEDHKVIVDLLECFDELTEQGLEMQCPLCDGIFDL